MFSMSVNAGCPTVFPALGAAIAAGPARPSKPAPRPTIDKDRFTSQLSYVAHVAQGQVAEGMAGLAKLQTPDAGGLAPWWAVRRPRSADDLAAMRQANRETLTAVSAVLTGAEQVIGAERTPTGERKYRVYPRFEPAAALIDEARHMIAVISQRGGDVKPSHQAALLAKLAELHQALAVR